MITAVRPYSPQQKQNQNFGLKIQDNLLQGCRDGNCDLMNRIRALAPKVYTIEDNQAAIREIIEDPKTKMTKTLQIIGRCFGVIKD